MEQKRSIFGPLLLIAAGVIWLLVKSGSVPSENLWALTHIWPYLLVAAGLGLILRAYWKYATILLDVLVISIIVLTIVFARQLGWTNPSVISIMSNNDFYIGPSEPGSGNVITETRNVSDFSAIEVDYPAQVFVTQGESTSIKVEAEDNVLPGLQTRVRNDKLEIFYEVEDGGHINPTKAVKITIVVDGLKKVEFDSAGGLNIDKFETDELDVSVNGAGNLKLNNIITKNLRVNLSGAGGVVASGETNDFHLTISGFGSFNGEDLQTQVAHINLSGAGSATLWVEEHLDTTISGAGSVNYYGSPTVKKQINGIGGVNRLGDK